MATELEITFIDEGAEAGTDQPIDTRAAGAPIGGHSQLATERRERDADAPRQEHFRALTNAISELTRRIPGREAFSTEGPRGGVAPQTVGPTVKPSDRQQTVNDQIKGLADRINDRITGAVKKQVPAPARPFVDRVLQPALERAGQRFRPQARRPGARPSTDAELSAAARSAFDRAVARSAAKKAVSSGGFGAGTAAAGGLAAAGGAAAGAARVGGTALITTAATAGGTAATAGSLAVIPAGSAGGAAGAGIAAAGGVLTALTGPIGIALAGVTVGLVLLGKAVGAVNRRFESIADRIEPFSGPLLAVRARQEASRTVRQVEFAQRVGPNIARAAAARGDLNSAIERFTNGLDATLSELAPITSKLNQFVALEFDKLTAIKEIAEAAALGGLSAKQNQEAFKAIIDLKKGLFKLLGIASAGNTGNTSTLDSLLGVTFQNPPAPPANAQPNQVPPNPRPVP